MFKKSLISAAVLVVTTIGAATAATEADVDKAFNPYKGGLPTVEGLVPGTVINKANVEKFKDAN